jgi:hypothetical protein
MNGIRWRGTHTEKRKRRTKGHLFGLAGAEGERILQNLEAHFVIMRVLSVSVLVGWFVPVAPTWRIGHP